MAFGRTVFIGNPAANNGAGAADIAALESLAQANAASFSSLEFIRTAGPGDAAARARAVEADLVVAVGGDGTIHEVVSSLMERPPADRASLGVIPCGNGNDFARTLGMPVGVAQAFPALLAAEERPLDVGLCNGVPFMQTLSFGLDAAIALGTHDRRVRTGQTGTSLFVSEGIEQLLHHRDEYAFEAAFDGMAERGRMMMFAVQNGRTYGGGFDICPEAEPSDGMLDICYASAPLGLVPALLLFLRAKGGNHVGSRTMTFHRVRALDVAFDPSPPAQIDGERIESPRYRVQIEPAALSVLFARR